jgi:patatin-like phospholipase/acyl hydrolase
MKTPAFSTVDSRARISLKKITRQIAKEKSDNGAAAPGRLRILSIDGGGMRALLPAVFLAKLEERLQQLSGDPQARVADHFDLFCGTSAGGILTSLYLTPDSQQPTRPRYSARQVLQLYLKGGCDSFTVPHTDPAARRKEKYNATSFEDRLKYALGADVRLGQWIRPALLTAFDQDREMPHFFKSWQHTHLLGWQAVRATSAAPGIFRPAQYQELLDGRMLVDGSVFAGNPAMCAYTLASSLHFSKIKHFQFQTDRPSAENMLMVSVGTGKIPVATEDKAQGIRQMMKNLMSSGIDLVDHQLRLLFSHQGNEAYFRFNPLLPLSEAAVDNAGPRYVNTLIRTATGYFEEHQEKMDQLITQLLM